MDKRLPLVLVTCVLIMVGWTMLFPPQPPPKASAAAADDPAALTAARDAAPSAEAPATVPEKKPEIGPRVVDAEEREVVLTVGSQGRPGYYRAVFTNRGGALVELRTGNFFDRAGRTQEERERFENWAMLCGAAAPGTPERNSMILRTSSSSRALESEPLDRELWTMRELGSADAPEGVEFKLAPGTGVVFTKRFRFVPGEYTVMLELEIENTGATLAPGAKEFRFTPAAWVPNDSGDQWYIEPQALAASRAKGSTAAVLVTQNPEFSTPNAQGTLAVAAPLSFVGVGNKYFAMLMHAHDEATLGTIIGASWHTLRDEAWARAHPDEAGDAWRQIVTDAHLELRLPPVGETSRYAYAVYSGPKDRELLERAWPDHAKLVEHDLGYFSGIASVLLLVLNFFESLFGNWGVAIILLTISVRGLLFPVNRRSQTAMARYQTKMKRLQPKIEELKKKFEKDSSRLRQEQAKLMQQEGAFPPLGGCLPMFVQMPVFIGLYRALGVSFDLRQAPFVFWIHDLSLPDRLMALDWNTHLPLIGTIAFLNVLPPIMVALWIWQQRGMPMPADEQQARMQKMMLWMPVMMGFFLYNYAAGLSLYMITQSGLGVIEQKVIKKFWPVDETEVAPKKTGFMARMMAAQQEQMKKMQVAKRQPARKVRR